MNLAALLADIDKGPDARAKLLDAFLRISVPLQIRMLRESRGWTQLDLARRCKMTQSAIARLETIGGDLPTIKTLQRIAEACGVALLVAFKAWSDVLPQIEHLAALAPLSFDDEFLESTTRD